MAFNFHYRLTDKAKADLDEIVSYIAVELGQKQAAAAFFDQVQDAVSQACAYPQSGALVDNEYLQIRTVRKKPVGNYILFYYPDMEAQTIYVLRVIYGRRNLEQILMNIQ